MAALYVSKHKLLIGISFLCFFIILWTVIFKSIMLISRQWNSLEGGTGKIGGPLVAYD